VLLTLLAQGRVDPNAALNHAATFDNLTYVLCLGMLLTAGLMSVVVWKVVIPWCNSRTAREDKLAENNTTLVRAFDQQTTLIASIPPRIDALHEKVDEHSEALAFLRARHEIPPRRRGDDNCKPPCN
jgi:hypothetical protein